MSEKPHCVPSQQPRRRFRFLALLVAAALFASACTSEPTTNSNSADSGEQNSSTDETDSDSDSDSSSASSAGPNPDPTRIDISDDIRTGVLDNGLTYFVQSNDSPGGSVALRLAIKAGGLHESPVGTGTAHFLEHMMFNGTEQFPGASLDATLRSIGAEIGPDFNAYTADSETVYQLQVADQGDNVSIAFDVLAEWASAALIEPAEVEAEAPVVREELRLRDESGDGLIGVAFEEAYYLGTPYEGVSVSGTADTVNAITEQELRAFYDTWYRPDNMAVIAVGDQSLDELEDQIVDRFADMEARGEILDQPVVGEFELRSEPLVEVEIVPSFGDSFISVDIPIRSWDAGTIGGAELFLTEVVLGIAIDNRLSEGVESGRLDLRRAGGGWFPYNRDLAYLGFNVDADDMVAGTEVLMTELEGSLQNPFTQAEIDRAAAAISTFEEQRIVQFDTTQDSDFADEMVSFFLDGADISNVEDSVDRNLSFLESLTAEAANEHWGWMLTQSAPIVLAVGPDAERVGTAADHLAAVEAGSLATVAAVDDDVEEIEVLVPAPDPVEEIEFNDVSSGEFEMVFANGHSVLFADSTISEGEIFLVSESPGGRSVLSTDDGPLAPIANAVVSSSGLAEWSPTQLRRYLATIDASISPVVSDFTEGFSGTAATADAETLFQLLHLFVTEPRVDEVPFAQRIESTSDAIEQVTLDSETASSVAASDGRSGGENFASLPTIEQLDGFTSAEAARIFDDRFSSLDDHTIVIVGDIDEDDVRDYARTWIGTLPPAAGTDSPSQYPPIGNVEERLAVGSGTAGGSFFLIAIGSSPSIVENQVIAELASRIVDDRIFTVIREELGASYGGFSFTQFVDPGQDVDLVISINGDPARIDEIAQTVDDELVAIAAGQTTTEDFDEAVAVLAAEYGFINNSFIIEQLFAEAAGDGGDRLDRQRQIAALNAISPDDVAAFVGDIITSGQRVDVRNIPE